jgi:hypothetical protein
VKKLLALSFALAITAATLATGARALAAAPSNDNFANATLIPTAGFTDRVKTTEATLEPNEYSPCFGFSITNSVWYKFSAGDSRYDVYFDTAGSDFTAFMTVYRETSDGLQVVSCHGGDIQFQVTAGAGETLYWQVTGTPGGATSATTGTGTTGTSTGGTSTGGTSTGGTSTSSTTTGGTSTGGTASITSTPESGNLVFHVTTVQYIPIDMTLTIDSRASVNAAGDVAIVTGTVTCSRVVAAQIQVSLTQVHAKRFVAMGNGVSEGVQCGATAQRWSVTVYDGGPIRFGSGGATADAYAYADDGRGSGQTQTTGVEIRLKH